MPPQRPRRRRRTAILIAAACLVVVAVATAAFFGIRWLAFTHHPDNVHFGPTSFFRKADENHVATDKEANITYVDNMIYIYVAPGVTRAQVKAIMAEYDAELVGMSERSGTYQFRFSRSLTYDELQDLSKRTQKLSEVRAVEPVIPDPPSVPDPDPEPPHKPSKKDKTDDAEWGLVAIKAREAWDELGAAPGEGVAVGVNDTQFFADHEDLEGAFADMYEPYRNGFSAWYNSPQYFGSKEWRQDPTYDPNVDEDDEGATHGTHVAGIIAARNNSVGSVGVAHGASLYGWQDGLITAERAADGSTKAAAGLGYAHALEWLVGECGCKVVNLSAGYSDPASVSDAERTASAERLAATIESLVAAGHEFVVVVSAGNDPEVAAALNNQFSAIESQTAANRIIVVGSIGRTDDGSYVVSDFSSGGKRVDVLAPGSEILSTSYEVNEGTHEARGIYQYKSGTSMAAPMVSGVAALAFQANPDLTGAQVKSIICDVTDGAKTYAGTSGNATPKRRLVDAKETVRLAKKTKGKAGRGQASGYAQSFVTRWYDDLRPTSKTGVNAYVVETKGEGSYPKRLLPMIEKGSAAWDDFTDDLSFPKDGWTCVTKSPTAKYLGTEDGHRLFRVTVHFATTEREHMGPKKYKKLTESSSKAVWEIGVNTETGKVDYVANVSGYETPEQREAREEAERKKKEEEERKKKEEEERRRQEEEERKRQEEEERQEQIRAQFVGTWVLWETTYDAQYSPAYEEYPHNTYLYIYDDGTLVIESKTDFAEMSEEYSWYVSSDTSISYEIHGNGYQPDGSVSSMTITLELTDSGLLRDCGDYGTNYYKREEEIDYDQYSSYTLPDEVTMLNGYWLMDKTLGDVHYAYIHDGVFEGHWDESSDVDTRTFTYGIYYDTMPGFNPGDGAGWGYPELGLYYMEETGYLCRSNEDATHISDTFIYVRVDESSVPDWAR